MVLLLATFNLILTCWFIYKTIRCQELDLFFWLSLFFIFALPGFFDAFSVNDDARRIILIHAFLFAIAFNLFFWFTKRLLLKQRYIIQNNNYFGPKSLLRIILFILCLSVLLLIIHIYIIFGISPVNIGMMLLLKWREVAFENDTIFRAISHRLMIIGSAACLLAWVQKKYKLFSLSVFLVLLITFVEGSRFILASAFVPFIFYYLSSKLKISNIIKGTLMGFIFVFLVYHVQTIRYQDKQNYLESFNYELLSLTTKRIFNLGLGNQEASGEMRIREYYYFVIDKMPNPYPISWGRTYKRLMLFPFPTSLLKGIKPTEYTKVIANYIYPEREGFGGTVPPLIYGESYANFKRVGIVLGIFWGCIFSLLGHWYRNKPIWLKIVMLSPIASFSLFLARGQVYSSVVFLIYGAIVIWALVIPLIKIFSFKIKSS